MNSTLNEVVIYTDGGSRGNPGRAAYGFIAFGAKGEKIYQESQKIGIATNNTAEYTAVIKALEWVTKNTKKPPKVTFFLDSLLVVMQLSGRYKIKSESIRSLYFKVKELEEKISASVSYTQIPREKNYLADALVNKALDGI